MEILATPEDCILYKNPLMDGFRQEDFLSKLCKETFGGYASTQIQKARGLHKKIVNPIEKERKGILDFCVILENSASIPAKDWLDKKNFSQERCGLIKMPHSKGIFALFYNEIGDKNYSGIFKNEDSNEVSLSSVPKGEKSEAYLFFNQDAYSTYCKNYKEYWDWVAKRNEDRYNTNQQHGKNYDSKNMMHTIRLLQSAVNIFKSNKLEIRVKNREELLDIKAGNWNYDDLLSYADELLEEFSVLNENSTLQDFPNKEKAEKNLIRLRTELYR